MKTIEYSIFSEFIDDVFANMGLQLRHRESATSWEVFATDGALFFVITLDKGSDDAADFENDYLSLSNLPPEQTIAEENHKAKTGGHFSAETLYCSIPAGTPGEWTSYQFDWKFPISLLAAEWPALIDNDGDEVRVKVGENTTIGAISADVSINDTEITVDASTLAYMRVGYMVRLWDGVNSEDLGICTAIDKAAGKITVETASTQAFTASSPTYVQQTVKMVPWLLLKGSGFAIDVGHSKIGGSYLPTGTKVKIEYRNNNGASKKFPVNVEYLY